MSHATHPLRGRGAIVGIGNTRRWNAPGRTPFDQLQEAAVLALEDCGLRMSQIDGLFCAMSTSGLPVLNVAERLGIKPRHADGTMVGGASFLFHLQSALMALELGLCEVALICYGSNQLTAGGKLASMPDPQPYESPFRPRYPLSSYALAAARHITSTAPRASSWPTWRWPRATGHGSIPMPSRAIR